MIGFDNHHFCVKIMEEHKGKKTKHFMETPQYPGGRKALEAFITAHLQYPEDAMEQRLEGTVTVAYQVTDEGEIENPTIIKSLSPSCDEEAVRLVKLLRYGKAHNRGYRLKSNCKIHIHFRLAPQPQQPTLTITYTTSSKPKTKSKPATQKNTGGYSITLNR